MSMASVPVRLHLQNHARDWIWLIGVVKINEIWFRISLARWLAQSTRYKKGF